MVNPLKYFPFQPVIHNWCNKGYGMSYPVCGQEGRKCFTFNNALNTFYLRLYGVVYMWDGAYKHTPTANQKEQQVSSPTV